MTFYVRWDFLSHAKAIGPRAARYVPVLDEGYLMQYRSA